MCGPIPDTIDRDVMADEQLSGFVDWEFAGWYPEHWEYTKACYICVQMTPLVGNDGKTLKADGLAQIDQILGNPSMTSQTPESRCRALALDGHAPTRVARLHNMGIVDAADTSVVMAKPY
ncbi:conserved hypothetical protein [Histoplasma capsulatum G186AR]|uniref:Uncharacterized protein n=1 Tax=Ajellomyces capsulatus (strain G186AR / H82 / ATCC MYA-2454 / RMSCC 2432) TaxID=447093 RepID=C0NSC4_AJECG|nr:uncharacterized protein HCBG_06054 [Histoplasma capsulatum G186AR]EEH05790.1 conserved hypothetical protein [Histoplasma capsulatum G186AR]